MQRLSLLLVLCAFTACQSPRSDSIVLPPWPAWEEDAASAQERTEPMPMMRKPQAQTGSPTTSQTYFRRVVMERRPNALVMATTSNTILTAETQWQGHVLTLAQAYPLVKRGPVFLVEPLTNDFQVPPMPIVTDNVKSAVIQSGKVRYGLFATGRKVVIP